MFWGACIGGLTAVFDPLHKLAYAPAASEDIPDMGENAQDIVDMKLALYLRHPQPNVIIGNSRPYKGLPAEYMGDDWFNFAIPGANAKDLLAVVEFLTQCMHFAPPKNVVVMLDLNIYDLRRGNAEGRNFDLNKHRGKCIAHGLFADMQAHPSYFVDIRNIARILRKGEERYTDQGSYKDFPERLTETQLKNAQLSKLADYRVKGWGVRGIVQDEAAQYNHFSRALPYLNDLTARAVNSGAQVLLIWTPFHESLNVVMSEKNLHVIEEKIKAETSIISHKYTQTDALFMPLWQNYTIGDITKPRDGGYYFIEPSHFTSVFGRKIAEDLKAHF